MLRLLLATFLAVAVRGDFEAPRVTVDLDVDPEHRWDSIVAEYKDSFVQSLTSILGSPSIKKFVPIVKHLVGNSVEARRILPEDQYRELTGISRGMGVEVSDLVLISAFYDLFAAKGNPLESKACTGVVAQSSSGEIFHGRNLDYAFKDELSKIALAVDFVRNGTTVFSAVTFGPNPTFNTAVKYGSFSITQNERDTGNVLDNMWDLLIRGRIATMASIRQAMESVDSFDRAVNFFSNVKLSAAAYFILAGTKPTEGAVIARDRDGVSNSVPTLMLNPSSGSWYIVETNYDHAIAPPFGDKRRTVLERTLNATGPSHFNASSMWDVISVRHVNKQAGERAPLNSATIYSAVMQAAKRETFKVIVRSSDESMQTSIIV